MVNPRNSTGGFLADLSPFSSSSSSIPTVANTTPTDRASRRRTYHGSTSVSSSSATSNSRNTTSTTCSATPGTRASGRTNSNPNIASKFYRLGTRATAKRLFQVFSGGFSTSTVLASPPPRRPSGEIRSSYSPPPAAQSPQPEEPATVLEAAPSSTASPAPSEPSSTRSTPPPPQQQESQSPQLESQPSQQATTQRRHSETNIQFATPPSPPRPTPAATNRSSWRMSPPNMIAIGGGNTGIPSHQLSIAQTQSPRGSAVSLSTANRHGRSGSMGSISSSSLEKPLAITSGGQISVDIRLAEPYLFLQGYDAHHNQNVGGPAMLRGTLVVKVSKPAKIKTVSLSFKGRARTDWPEGIPPSKTAFFEEKEIMTHTWPFFNAHFPSAEISHGADSTRFLGAELDSRGALPTSPSGAISSLARASSPVGLSAAASTLANDKRLSLQGTQSRSRGDSPSRSVASRGYRMFQPGEYSYNFELPIESILPETIQCDLGSVKYELEATIERAGAFRPNLVGKKEVVLIRCPVDASLEQVEPIAISRNWEDQLHYDIVISGKSFPMGSQIPIAFKLTPLAKVRCHRIKIYVTENIEYFCRNKKVHRIEPTRKIQIFEKRADGPVHAQYPGSTVRITSGGRQGDPDNPNSELSPNQKLGDNLLGDLTGDLIGPTEMEFQVRLPGCGAKEGKIHFDTTYRNIQVHHWIKIVMRLSKVDPNDSSKRRHFEISIDSPFHILSCKCSQANTALPAYTDRNPAQQPTTSCSCPSARRDSHPFAGVENVLPDTAPDNTPRPLHLIRTPSFNPPAFDDDVAPPPLATPPPHYDSLPGGGLADYFARLADQTADEEDMEDDSPGSRSSDSRSPRLARSLDERRTWMPLGAVV